MFKVLREYNLEPDLAGTDQDIADIEASYTGRGGVFEILQDTDGNLLGTAGLFPIDSQTIELRKMYFDKSLRGRGFGRLMLSRLIEKARELGYQKIYLETAKILKEAVALYEKFGFQPTDEQHTPRCDAAYFWNLNESTAS